MTYCGGMSVVMDAKSLILLQICLLHSELEIQEWTGDGMVGVELMAMSMVVMEEFLSLNLQIDYCVWICNNIRI